MVSTRRTTTGSLLRMPEKGKGVQTQAQNPFGGRQKAKALASSSAPAPKGRTRREKPAPKNPKSTAKRGSKTAAAPSVRGRKTKRAAAATKVNGKKAAASLARGRQGKRGGAATRKSRAQAAPKKPRAPRGKKAATATTRRRATTATASSEPTRGAKPRSTRNSNRGELLHLDESGKAAVNQTSNGLGKRKRGANSASTTTGRCKTTGRTTGRSETTASAPTEAVPGTRTRSTRNSNRGELVRLDESGNGVETQESNPLRKPRRGGSSTKISLKGKGGGKKRASQTGGQSSNVPAATTTSGGTASSDAGGEDFVVFEDEPGTPPGDPPGWSGLPGRTNTAGATQPSTSLTNNSNKENVAPPSTGIASRLGGLARSLFGGARGAASSSNQATRPATVLIESDPDDEPGAEDDYESMGDNEVEDFHYAAHRAERTARFNAQMEAYRNSIDASHLQATSNLPRPSTSQQRLTSLQSALDRTQTARGPAEASTHARWSDEPRRASAPTGTRQPLGSPFGGHQFGDHRMRPPPQNRARDDLASMGPRRATMSPRTMALVDQFGAERNEISDDRIRP